MLVTVMGFATVIVLVMRGTFVVNVVDVCRYNEQKELACDVYFVK